MGKKARRCFLARSPGDWVHKVFLTCDNMLAVQFNRHMKEHRIAPHGPGAFLGHGGVPGPCCLYPGTQGELAEELYDVALVWTYAGEFVRKFLYRKFAYQLIAPPEPCGNCNTQCSLTLDPPDPQAGQGVTITCRVTNTDGSATKGEAPEGTIDFFIDGALLGSCTLPEDEPDSKNWAECTIGWGASCEPNATHTMKAVYTPSAEDWAATSCGGTITVSGCGMVQTKCCPNPIPLELHLTVIGSCLAGTYALTYDAASDLWFFDGTLCGIGGTFFRVRCEADGLWHLESNAFGIVSPSLTVMSCDPVDFEAANIAILPAYGGGGNADAIVSL